ncbi:hypothetical protein O9G_002834 [Rozella allomycis CSF55]|uniref:Uncharacterized protein n=1 Tax=Rozella allomycis (strain CSF55) TaxID=988480 RepID=A0A075ARJ8_ROZAC|nr:hypothetical protein O9G_002834 [Rozella allomycis CSF55]|eukprot:EPZ32916.1 hypothetical protein O9G_002834 [Rozella allomycis CSF55]
MITIIYAIVPGSLKIDILNPPRGFYCSGEVICYKIEAIGVPPKDPVLGQTFIEVEIRGGRPGSGPRGFIDIARKAELFTTFKTRQCGKSEYKIPNNFGNFTYFLRPNLFFESENGGSSNFRNSAASKPFLIKNC